MGSNSWKNSRRHRRDFIRRFQGGISSQNLRQKCVSHHKNEKYVHDIPTRTSKNVNGIDVLTTKNQGRKPLRRTRQISQIHPYQQYQSSRTSTWSSSQRARFDPESHGRTRSEDSRSSKTHHGLCTEPANYHGRPDHRCRTI